MLRLGHRPERDKRITTHVGLTARALGAKGMLLAHDDANVKRSVEEVSKKWGGDFFVRANIKWKKEIEEWKKEGGKVCHLTMYGENILDVIEEIKEEMEKENSRIMVVVGAEKIPREMFGLADWNIAAGNQPHSEIAALALFLDYLQEGKELRRLFEDAEIEIVPAKKEKKVKKL